MIQRTGLAGGGRYGDGAGTEGRSQLYCVNAQAPACARDDHRFAGRYADRQQCLEGHPHRTGQQRSGGQVQRPRQRNQAVLGNGDKFSESPVPAVADPLAVAAAVLPACVASVAVSARAGQQRRHAVAGLNAGDAPAHVLHDSGYLVSEDDARKDAATQRSVHDRKVVVAEAAGSHADKRFPSSRARDRHVGHRQRRGRSGLFQHQGAHNASLYARSSAPPTMSLV